MDLRADQMEIVRYFQIQGGVTVLGILADGQWIRWDDRAGIVYTSLWTLEEPRLIEITRAQALELIALTN